MIVRYFMRRLAQMPTMLTGLSILLVRAFIYIATQCHIGLIDTTTKFTVLRTCLAGTLCQNTNNVTAHLVSFNY